MKPIGPYVAARELPTGTNDSAVRTLRATDRLTGMPVLLHVLPYALNLPELPEHPNLLPFVDSGMDDQQAYMVTELPLQAVPATDATLAARGALAALAALHGRGLPHGGVSAAQLWSVDGRVVLTGAGLPWHDSPSPDGDLQALIRALDEIGLFPAALRPLRESTEGWDAGSALALLDGTGSGVTPARARQANPVSAPQHDGTPIVLGLTDPAASKSLPAAQRAEVTDRNDPAASAADAALSDTALSETALSETVPPPLLAQTAATPVEVPVEMDAEVDAAQTTLIIRPAPTAQPGDAGPSRTSAVPISGIRIGDPPDTHPGRPPVPSSVEPTDAAPPPAPQPKDARSTPIQRVDSQPGGPRNAPEDVSPAPGRAPVSPFSTAPAGAVETPQDRRRRQNEERRAQAMLDAQAAAGRRAEQLRADAAARQAGAGAIPPLIQIGFPAGSPGTAFSSGLGAADGGRILGEDDLPDWTPPDASTERSAQDGSGPDGADGKVRGRGLLKMRDVERLPESLRRPAEPEPEPAPAPLPLGRLPSRHVAGGPIRIGWDEDDSWRVVKTAAPDPAAAASRPPRWLIPALIAALLLLGVLWTIRVVASRAVTAAPAAVACCDVAFTLRGAAGATARLTVESAPSGANLTPGQELGEAPGRVRFPVQGTYRLRVVAEGYESAALSLTVPRTQPVSIDLGS